MWTLDQARNTYNLDQWGQGYVDINASGHLVVRPRGDRGAPTIDLHELSIRFAEHGLRLPVLVRFMDILHDRIDRLCEAFSGASNSIGYRGHHYSIYPVKVNQQHSVVAEILAHGNDRTGLEAGSKAELLAVLAVSRAGGIVVCNGYKDRAYIRLALIGIRLGHQVVIVIEKHSELELVLEESRALNIDPLLGVRVRLASLGTGKWQNSGGERAKFGLDAARVLELAERLRTENQLDSLQLLHCHLGSQVTNIRDIDTGMRELTRYFLELRQLGAGITMVDVGGGLGIDYEGTSSRSTCSVNYSVEQYARTIVDIFHTACEKHSVPHPDIITEAGRAITAHHAVLVTNVIDIERAPGTGPLENPGDAAPQPLRELWAILDTTETPSVLESYHNARYWLRELYMRFASGDLALDERARGEAIYYSICHRLRSLIQGGNRKYHEVLDELNEKLADKYFCNLSVFQSLPDVWAIRQIFPIVPLHRLDDPPTRRAVLQDVTCDSDGRIDQYVDRSGIESTLPVHPWRRGDSYLLGIFLVGAYQEILGDMHNLFGDTDAVDVRLADDGYTVSGKEFGDTTDELLRYVHFNTDDLRAAYREKLAAAELAQDEATRMMDELENGLGGYTYFEQ